MTGGTTPLVCHKCQSTRVRELPFTRSAVAICCRCECGHVWIVLRADPDGPVHDVTVRSDLPKH